MKGYTLPNNLFRNFSESVNCEENLLYFVKHFGTECDTPPFLYLGEMKKKLLEMGEGKQETGRWIWNGEINCFLSTFFIF